MDASYEEIEEIMAASFLGHVVVGYDVPEGDVE